MGKIMDRYRVRVRAPFAWGVALVFLLGAAAAGEAMAAPGITTRVSVDSAGSEADGESPYNGLPSISADGRYVAFDSYATNLVAGDTNGVLDVFVHDRRTGQTTRVSVDNTGAQGNGESSSPSISADGRYVAFYSDAANLVAGDTNGFTDVFVHDRQTGQTTRVSVDGAGNQADSMSYEVSISADGRYVAFVSYAANLVAVDNNYTKDIFVRDRQTGQTTLVSVDSAGNQGIDGGTHPAISGDGRYVAFQSSSPTLVPGDTNGSLDDIFVHDRQTGQTTSASVDSAGNQGNDWSMYPSISADGRYVTFQSWASNLVPGDSNGWWDIFVHDRQTGQTTRVSVDSAGGQADSDSNSPSISGDGRYVAFQSWASNLVPGDTNGLWDIFVHDRQTGRTTPVSVDNSGFLGDGDSFFPTISADGKSVAFGSYAANLVPGDTNSVTDVFVRKLPTPRAVPNDFDGDGKADIVVWRPVNGTWYVKPSSGTTPLVVQWGDESAGDVVAPGDYDGDGKADFAVWRPSNGTWYVKPSSGDAAMVVQWGDQAAGDVPMPGDYDGDEITDIAVWRPSDGTWYVKPSSGAAPMVMQWGASGDKPVR